MSRPQQPTSPGIGQALKDARRRIGMDVKEAEDRTKIRARYLRALEAEDWEVLPAPAYIRGFLRTYGQLLGLDGEALADEYRRRSEEPLAAAGSVSEPVLQERRRAPGSRPPSRTPLIIAVAAVIIVLLIILGSIGGGDDNSGTPSGKGLSKLERKRGKGGKRGGSSEEQKSGKSKPVKVQVEPLGTSQVCLVGDGKKALIDSQVLAVGASEEFTDYRTYRLDLEGGGSVKLTAAGDSQHLEADGNASYEADSKGIRMITYAGPDCP